MNYALRPVRRGVPQRITRPALKEATSFARTYTYSVMQAYGDSFCRDVVFDSVNMACRDEIEYSILGEI